MAPIKKFTALLYIVLFSVSTPLWSQTVKVKKDESRVKGENVMGYAVDLEGKPEEISASFTKFLKTLGKVRQNEGAMTHMESTINGTGYKSPVYGVAKTKGVWLGVKKAEWADGTDNINKDLEKLVHEFGVKFYRDKIQVQIDESTRALLAVEKQQQRLTTQSRDLNMKLEDNKREKIQLEKSIENNKLQYGALLKKIEKNKHDQDSLIVAGEQVKKMVEAHKVRQGKVN